VRRFNRSHGRRSLLQYQNLLKQTQMRLFQRSSNISRPVVPMVRASQQDDPKTNVQHPGFPDTSRHRLRVEVRADGAHDGAAAMLNVPGDVHSSLLRAGVITDPLPATTKCRSIDT
jgi:hypothetical protein